jgi:hypothetical protein
MAGLSNIFGSDSNEDTTSSNDSGADGSIVGDLTSTVGLDASSSQTSQSTDEDGNSSSDTSDNALSLDTGTDGLLGGMGNSFDSSDESTS